MISKYQPGVYRTWTMILFGTKMCQRPYVTPCRNHLKWYKLCCYTEYIFAPFLFLFLKIVLRSTYMHILAALTRCPNGWHVYNSEHDHACEKQAKVTPTSKDSVPSLLNWMKISGGALPESGDQHPLSWRPGKSCQARPPGALWCTRGSRNMRLTATSCLSLFFWPGGGNSIRPLVIFISVRNLTAPSVWPRGGRHMANGDIDFCIRFTQLLKL